MGMGSKRGGHSSGRGDKGAKARGKGVPYLGFEGGQTPLYKRIPKRGHKNLCVIYLPQRPRSFCDERRRKTWVVERES